MDCWRHFQFLCSSPWIIAPHLMGVSLFPSFNSMQSYRAQYSAIIQIATFFWLIAWICLISRTFLLISWLFFTMGGKIEKSHGGPPPGPRGGAEAGVRREAPNGGRSGAPRARRWTPVWFFNFPTHRENKVKILSKKVRDTQANPRYSAKNNVAMRMIATFMPTLWIKRDKIWVFHCTDCSHEGNPTTLQ